MRIARALALAGIASRRKSEEHIQNGAVAVNGEVIEDLGRQVDVERDAITFRGRLLQFHRSIYYMLNKPCGYMTTTADPHAKKTVFELLPKMLVTESRQPKQNRIRVFPVGRLDRDSKGLLLFTNDGALAHQLMHPRFEVSKLYEVRLGRPLELWDRRRLLEGVKLEDGPAKAERIRVLSRRVLQLWIREGRNREVRRIFDALGYKVVELKRVALGPLRLGHLQEGEGRYLTKTEVEALRKSAGKS